MKLDQPSCETPLARLKEVARLEGCCTTRLRHRAGGYIHVELHRLANVWTLIVTRPHQIPAFAYLVAVRQALELPSLALWQFLGAVAIIAWEDPPA